MKLPIFFLVLVLAALLSGACKHRDRQAKSCQNPVAYPVSPAGSYSGGFGYLK